MPADPPDPAPVSPSPRAPDNADSAPVTVAVPPASAPDRGSGIDVALSDGGDAPTAAAASRRLHIPYTDAGIDVCAMELIAADGTRTPHRPQSVAAKCKQRWQAADQDAPSERD